MLFHTNDAAKVPFISAAAAAHKAWRHDFWERYSEAEHDEGALFDPDRTLDQEAEDRRASEASIVEIMRNITSLLEGREELSVPANARDIFGASIGTAGEKKLRAARKALATQGLIEPLPPKTRPGQGPIRRAL